MRHDYNDRDDMFDGMDSDRGDRYDGKESRRFSSNEGFRKKACRFCADTELLLDYKSVRTLQSFVSEQGKITPRRISGNCAFHQRQLTSEVKRARNLALLGYTNSGA